MATKKALCLNMIVKNEMANLDRCLRSLAPYIDCWVIGDTGSTDGTQDFIRAFFAERGVPGELHEFPFIDFAQARNEALERARASSLPFDYILLTDADMELTVEDGEFASRLSAAAYNVLQRSGVAYWNVRLVGRRTPSSYKGVTHEFLDIGAGRTLNLDGVAYIDHATGANRPEKYERDVRLLTSAIEAEADPGMIARYTFYLANTYKDAGRQEIALAAYLERAGLGHWQEEVFVSLLNAAEIRESLGRPDEEVLAAYEAAARAAPWRAEALHAAARFCRNRGRHAEGHEFARRGLALAYPRDALFVQDWVYDYGLLDEFALNAYWAGRHLDSEAACRRLLAEGKLPADQRARIEENLAFAVARLSEAGSAASPETDAFLRLLDAARATEAAGGAIEDILAAYAAASEADPTRAEALYESSRFCRLKQLNERARAYAERGLALPCPDDAPGLERWIYDWGLIQELSIAAYYAPDPAVKDRGFSACDWLALNRDVPAAARDLAAANLHFYLQPAAAIMPTFWAKPTAFEPPAHYRATNPAVARIGDEVEMIQRTVNYAVDPSVPHDDPAQYATHDGSPIHTRNFLLRVGDDLELSDPVEILAPIDMPDPAWPLVQGFEDLRPFAWRGGLWCVACVRELTPQGWCEMVRARIGDPAGAERRLVDWRVMQPEGPRLHQKNWMPFVDGDDLRFVHLCDPTRIVDAEGRTLSQTVPAIFAETFRGGSALVAFCDGQLAVIHEMHARDGQRHYRHRFVWFDEAMRLRGLSRPFFFHDHGIEFVAGLAWHPDGERLILSYGVGDAEAWIATVAARDVLAIMDDVQALPCGKPDAPRA